MEQVTRLVQKSSVFPASPEQVWNRLLELKTLQYIASPYACFTLLDGSNDLVWRERMSFRFRLRLCSLIPVGTHTICVLRFDMETGEHWFYTEEQLSFLQAWEIHALERLHQSTGGTTWNGII